MPYLLPVPIRYGLVYGLAPANAVAFRLRTWLRLGKTSPVLRAEGKNDLFRNVRPEVRLKLLREEAELRLRFSLGAFWAHSTRFDYRDALWRLRALTLAASVAPMPTRSHLRAVDAGAQNWHYVLPLHRFLSRHGMTPSPGLKDRQRILRNVELHGVELDVHVMHQGFHSRAAHAQAYMAQCEAKDVHYHEADFVDFAAHAVAAGRQFDVVTMFFPFLTRYALLQFGLPLSCFRPKAMLKAALSILAEDGVLYVFHQTAEEQAIFAGLLDGAGITVAATRALPPELAPDPEHAAARIVTVVVGSARRGQSPAHQHPLTNEPALHR